jgi:hypothetical protein
MSGRKITFGPVFISVNRSDSGLTEDYIDTIERTLYSGRKHAYCYINNKRYDVHMIRAHWNVIDFQEKEIKK